MMGVLTAAAWLSAGVAVAALHAWWLLHGVRGAVQAGSARALLAAAPLRMALPVGVLFGAATYGGVALAGAFAGFIGGGLAMRWRLGRPPAEVAS